MERDGVLNGNATAPGNVPQSGHSSRIVSGIRINRAFDQQLASQLPSTVIAGGVAAAIDKPYLTAVNASHNETINNGRTNKSARSTTGKLMMG